MSGALVGPGGVPLEFFKQEVCPVCGNTDGHIKITGFGGYWHLVCKCGTKIKSGRGDAPGGR